MTDRPTTETDESLATDHSRVPTRYSVTCALCGDRADERETRQFTTDLDELGGGIGDRFRTVLAQYAGAVDHGHGEVHRDCFRSYREQFARTGLRRATSQARAEVTTATEDLLEAYSGDVATALAAGDQFREKSTDRHRAFVHRSLPLVVLLGRPEAAVDDPVSVVGRREYDARKGD